MIRLKGISKKVLLSYKETENKAGTIESLLRIIWTPTESEQLVKSAKLLYAVKSELILWEEILENEKKNSNLKLLISFKKM